MNAIAELYPQVISTRKVQAIIKRFRTEQLAPSVVYRIAQDLDREEHEFFQRPIEQVFLYLFLDASYYTVHDGPPYVSKVLLMTAGFRDIVYRLIL